MTLTDLFNHPDDKPIPYPSPFPGEQWTAQPQPWRMAQAGSTSKRRRQLEELMEQTAPITPTAPTPAPAAPGIHPGWGPVSPEAARALNGIVDFSQPPTPDNMRIYQEAFPRGAPR